MKVSDEVVFLEEAFDVLNQRFFESALSRPAITIQSTPGAHGHFTLQIPAHLTTHSAKS